MRPGPKLTLQTISISMLKPCPNPLRNRPVPASRVIHSGRHGPQRQWNPKLGGDDSEGLHWSHVDAHIFTCKLAIDFLEQLIELMRIAGNLLLHYNSTLHVNHQPAHFRRVTPLVALTAWAIKLSIRLTYVLGGVGFRYISQSVGPLWGMVISPRTSNPWRW